MKSISQVFQFFKEVKSEMAKVKWPTVQDFVGATIIVLIVMVIFSLYLGAIDYACYKLLFEKILSI